MNYESIKVAKQSDGVAVVTLNQPKTLNSLSKQIIDDLSSAVSDLSGDDCVKAIVLTGEGKAFCAGGDLTRFKEGFTTVSGLDYIEGIHLLIKSWTKLKKPTIAAVNGAAAGAGMSLMLMCDIAYAAETAKMGCAFINMALIPDCGLAYYLPRAIGIQKAKELIFTGRMLGAKEAMETGLINQVFTDDSLMKEVLKIASEIAAKPAFALRYSKRITDMSLDVDFDSLLNIESLMQSQLFNTEDSKEAVSAFLAKRKPVFKGK